MRRALLIGAEGPTGAGLVQALHALGMQVQETVQEPPPKTVACAAEALGGPVDLLILAEPRQEASAAWALLQAFAAQVPQPVQSGRDLQASGVALIVLTARDLAPGADPDAAMVAQARLGLTRAAAQALAPRLRVNALGLGLPRPEPAPDHAAWGPAQAVSPAAGAGADIAATLAYLHDAAAVTGQLLCLGNAVFPA